MARVVDESSATLSPGYDVAVGIQRAFPMGRGATCASGMGRRPQSSREAPRPRPRSAPRRSACSSSPGARAQITGGEYVSAASADGLDKVLDNVRSRLGTVRQEVDISAGPAVRGSLVLLGAALVTLRRNPLG